MSEPEQTADDQLSEVLSKIIEAAIRGGMGVSAAEEVYDDLACRLMELEEHDARDVLKEIRTCLAA